MIIWFSFKLDQDKQRAEQYWRTRNVLMTFLILHKISDKSWILKQEHGGTHLCRRHDVVGRLYELKDHLRFKILQKLGKNHCRPKHRLLPWIQWFFFWDCRYQKLILPVFHKKKKFSSDYFQHFYIFADVFVVEILKHLVKA